MMRKMVKHFSLTLFLVGVWLPASAQQDAQLSMYLRNPGAVRRMQVPTASCEPL